MKTGVLVTKNWDDVVFENRNKEYGAYDLRQSYNKSMTTGLGVSITIACLLIVLPKILSVFGQDIDVKAPVANDKIICILPEPRIMQKIKPPVTPPNPEPPARQTSAANIQVINHDTDTEVVENQNVILPSTDEEGKGAPIEYTDPPIVAPPIVAPPKPPTICGGAEIMPKFDDMTQFLSRKLKYPSSARRMGITGRVFVGFVVAADGTINDVKIVKGFHPDCDKEAVRVVSLMPPWNPAMQNGQPVAVRMVVPINFQLQ